MFGGVPLQFILLASQLGTIAEKKRLRPLRHRRKRSSVVLGVV
jgi:hypothetical protein